MVVLITTYIFYIYIYDIYIYLFLYIHVAKFFDLSPADVIEIDAVKVSLYSNLAMCYIKLKNFDHVIRYCTDAIELDPTNVKSHFRRSSAWEHKKEWEKSLIDAQRAAELVCSAGLAEDKMINQSVDRIKREMLKIKEKEKKMYGKAFS